MDGGGTMGHDATALEADSGGKLLARIQQFVLQRRIRVRNFFSDFDGHHAGACSAAQFERAMDLVGITFLPGEMEELLANYRIPGAAPMVGVSYAAFCADVDQVFAHPLAASMTNSLVNSAASLASPRVLSGSAVQPLLERLAMLCQTRGVVLKTCYSDFGRGPAHAPARITPRQGGKVTKSQFIRLFPFAERFRPEEIQLLAEAFATETGDVHYQALHDAISGIMTMSPGDDPFMRSDLVLKPDGTEWSHSRLNPMDKLRSKVVEKRVRLYEHFQDFDALRKGTCTMGQVKTVFTILDITKVLSREDFDYIAGAFCRDDGMFDYRKFCKEADKDFTTPGLEKDPLTPVVMPDALTTSPGRRNRILIKSHNKVAEIEALHDRIASKIKKQRMLLMPTFQDMDRTRRGHISVSQFARVLVQLNLNLSDAEVDLLAAKYCDLGNHTDFNYSEFVQKVDPPSEAVVRMEALRASPRVADTPPKYFNAFGSVRPLDRGLGGAALVA